MAELWDTQLYVLILVNIDLMIIFNHVIWWQNTQSSVIQGFMHEKMFTITLFWWMNAS